MRDFYGYVQAAQEALLVGRNLRGRAKQRTRAAIGHALAFSTWRSLTQEQGLTADDAATLMRRLVESATRP